MSRPIWHLPNLREDATDTVGEAVTVILILLAVLAALVLLGGQP